MIQPRPVGLVDRATITTSIPLGISLGLAAKPIENLTAAFDLNIRSMKDTKSSVNWEQLRMVDETITHKEWNNLTQFAIGAEYILNAKFAKVPVRAGFRNNPSVTSQITKDNSGNLEYGSQITTNIISFGSGLTFEKAWIDVAYQFGSSSYSTLVNYFGNEKSIEQKLDYSRLFVSAGMNF
jgi:hypothetical protein